MPENKKPKQEKTVRVELVSKYNDTTHTEYCEYPAWELKGKNWGDYIKVDWWQNTDLFPYFEDLALFGKKSPVIVFEVYTVDANNVRNGRAQGLTIEEIEDDDETLLRWEAQFKNGKQHGKRIDYDYDIRVTRKARKSFYTNGDYTSAKTVAEWRKKQAEMRALAHSTQTRKK